MKVGRIAGPQRGERLVAVVTGERGERVLDLAAAAASAASPVAGTMRELIAGGAKARAQVEDVIGWAIARGDPGWFPDESAVEWLVPVEAHNCLCAGRNFGRHRDESLAFWKKQGAGGVHFEFPTGFVKLAHTLVPHRALVRRPEDVREFDFEVEVAAVIGAAVERVAPERALASVFGYTVFNDLSAREWQRKEMQNQMILIGKNFPGFGPIGPCILTADEVPDPAELVVDLKVNGQTLQHETCSDMIFPFAELIAWWSRTGFAAGDIVTSGTPEGVAMHRKPDPFAFYLKAGDVVHASVDRIGTLETRIG